MFRWIHHLLNPHCKECAIEKQNKLELDRLTHLEQINETKYLSSCESCETLRSQLAYTVHQNETLLARILEKPEKEDRATNAPVPVTRPTHIPWATRREILEKEDKAKAVAMRGAGQPIEKVQTIEEIEKELGVNNSVDEVNGNV